MTHSDMRRRKFALVSSFFTERGGRSHKRYVSQLHLPSQRRERDDSERNARAGTDNLQSYNHYTRLGISRRELSEL